MDSYIKKIWKQLQRKGVCSPPLYALFSDNHKWISYNPALDSFTEVDSIKDLNIWDVADYRDPRVWFMGSTRKPAITFKIKEVVKVP
jgi:hypothetical protein